MNSAGEDWIPSSILNETAEWLMRLRGSDCTDDTRQACAQWRQRSPQHIHAWERAERLLQYLGQLPSVLTLPTLGHEHGLDRRRTTKHLALVLGGASLGLATWQAKPLRSWLVDQRTDIGEQRHLALSDGSPLALNTDNAVDLAFDTSQRLVRLLRGEILVDSRADPCSSRVATAEARLHAGVTRLNVHQEMTAARVAVLAGWVELSPLHRRRYWLESDESVCLDADGEAYRLAFNGPPDAWTRGMLMTDWMPLAEVLAEPARYRRGLLYRGLQLARLAVSGAYPLPSLRCTLGMLQAIYPLKVHEMIDCRISLVLA